MQATEICTNLTKFQSCQPSKSADSISNVSLHLGCIRILCGCECGFHFIGILLTRAAAPDAILLPDFIATEPSCIERLEILIIVLDHFRLLFDSKMFQGLF